MLARPAQVGDLSHNVNSQGDLPATFFGWSRILILFSFPQYRRNNRQSLSRNSMFKKSTATCTACRISANGDVNKHSDVRLCTEGVQRTCGPAGLTRVEAVNHAGW